MPRAHYLQQSWYCQAWSLKKLYNWSDPLKSQKFSSRVRKKTFADSDAQYWVLHVLQKECQTLKLWWEFLQRDNWKRSFFIWLIEEEDQLFLMIYSFAGIIFFLQQFLSVHWSTLQPQVDPNHSLRRIFLCWNVLLWLEISLFVFLWSAWTRWTRTCGCQQLVSETHSPQFLSLFKSKAIMMKAS